ncbi:MAG: alginate lyase family protein [Planctomycetota bacterium]
MAQIKSTPDKDEQYRGPFKRLRKAAKQALDQKPVSVVSKKEAPPSGDKHDYMSYSRYWWPDPDSPDGLPYIRKDGKVNRPLVNRGDRNAIGELVDNVVSLSLANYLLDDKDAGARAKLCLKVWFLDESTRMNPHLKYAQAVPGKSEGRGVGIIDSRGFIWMLDAVELLHADGLLDEQEMVGLREWFSRFLDWLMTSPLAKEERGKENNHGSWFAAQASRIALFVDRQDIAREIATEVLDRRIDSQIDSEGKQAEELARTQPLHYSLFNLAALTVVAIFLAAAESK